MWVSGQINIKNDFNILCQKENILNEKLTNIKSDNMFFLSREKPQARN